MQHAAPSHDPSLAVWKVARLENKATGQFRERIAYRISDSDTHESEFAPSVVHNPREFESALLDRGARLPLGKVERKALLVSVAASEAPVHYVLAAQAGWIVPGSIFVLPSGAISADTTNVIGFHRGNGLDDKSGRLAIAGTVQSWRDNVAVLAGFGSVPMLAICAAFAAPLLAILGRQSFGLCLFAQTRAGKTMATLFAGSVIGISRSEDLISWNIKDARLEERLAEYNDLLFPIDDFSAAKGSEKTKYLRIRDLAYVISQGWTTGRHSSFTAAKEGSHAGWRCIFLTSFERSLSELARSARLERRHGEALRLIDMPAVLPGVSHIFDRMCQGANAKAMEDLKKSVFRAIASDCAENHGKVLESYITRIVTADFQLEEYLNKRIAEFVREVSEPSDGDVAQDVAEKFGIMYAAGRLARHWGLLPWAEPDLLDAVSKCYRAARELLPDEGVMLRAGLEILEARLTKLPRIKKKPRTKSSLKWDEQVGYRTRSSRAERYLIRCDTFNATFVSVPQRDIVLNWLVQNERITTKTTNATAGSIAKAPKCQFIWPDGKRRRSYELVFPRG